MESKKMTPKVRKKLPCKVKAEPVRRAWGFERGSFGAIKQVNYLIKGDEVVSKEYMNEDVREIVFAKIKREMIDVTMEG